MSDESVSVAEEVVSPGKSKPRSQASKKQNVKNAKDPKPAATVTKFRPKDKFVSRAADLIAVASDKTRLAILLNLAQNPLNVGEVCKILNTSQPAVSHHLALMRGPDVVETERDGKHNIYSLTGRGKTLVKFAKALMENDE
jgi:ArsR family transcriptional regulator